MSKPSLILIGAGGHARACIDVIEMNGQFQIAGFVGIPGEMNGKHFDYAVIATDNELPRLVKDYKYAVIAVGQIQTPDHRMRLFHMAIDLGFQLPVINSPSSYVSHNATIGAGTIVMHGAIVNAGAKVGANCIINSQVLVEHGTVVEDHCHISTGAILNGDVRIGVGSFVGSGSVVKEGVTIGQRSLVGMGLVVRQNLAEYTRFVGGDKS